MGQLSTALGVVPGTATSMVKALADAGLVIYEPYSGVRLTPAGEKLAAAVLRRHRLVELFLVQVMGMSWAEVHDEAEQLEHAVSDRLIDRIDEMLGRPAVDPHGDPIPDAEGVIHAASSRPCSRVRSTSRWSSGACRSGQPSSCGSSSRASSSPDRPSPSKGATPPPIASIVRTSGDRDDGARHACRVEAAWSKRGRPSQHSPEAGLQPRRPSSKERHERFERVHADFVVSRDPSGGGESEAVVREAGARARAPSGIDVDP